MTPVYEDMLFKEFNKQGECLICGKVIKQFFASHIKLHKDHNNWDFMCKFKALGKCDYNNTPKSPFHCKSHMLRRHFKFDDDYVPLDRQEEVYKHEGTCECGYHGGSKTWLNDHVLKNKCPLLRPDAIVPPRPQYPCSMCDRSFAREVNWLRHLPSHRGNWDFTCKFKHLGECGYRKDSSCKPHGCIRHMLNVHFKFDKLRNTSKLPTRRMYQFLGKCKCGYKGRAKIWVDEHVLGDQCPLIKEPSESDAGE